jgi:hypothetical protein
MHSRALVFGAIILFAFSMTDPMVSQGPQDRGQSPQTRPAPGGNQGGNHNRPQPGLPNPGGNRPQPNRPSPGRPNPGGGNNRPQPGRPNPGPQRPPQRPNRPGRPPQWGQRPPNRPSYNFRPNNRAYLHRYYQRSLLGINRANRPHFIMGGFFPYAYIPYISPLPPTVYGYLPPPPPGYSMGYYQGYVVVYDPITYFIANVIDLLQ